MPMFKIGVSYYKGQSRPVCLLQGVAIRDGEHAPIQGKPHAKVAVAADQTREGETIFVTLNGWRDKANVVARVRKMDSLLAIGVLKQKLCGGVTYYDLDVDFLCRSGSGFPGAGVGGFPPEEDSPTSGEWEDMQHTRALWQRLQEEEAVV